MTILSITTMKARIALKIVRHIQERPELFHSYNRRTVARAVNTVYCRNRLTSWIKSHVRLRLGDRTAVKMPNGTYAFMLNEDFDRL